MPFIITLPPDRFVIPVVSVLSAVTFIIVLSAFIIISDVRSSSLGTTVSLLFCAHKPDTTALLLLLLTLIATSLPVIITDELFFKAVTPLTHPLLLALVKSTFILTLFVVLFPKTTLPPSCATKPSTP